MSDAAREKLKTVARQRYVDAMMESSRHHIYGDWPVEECVDVYLHWLIRYPEERYYERHHGLPQADFRHVIGECTS